MILITGATGTVGRKVVRLLLEQDCPVAAVTRSPASDYAKRPGPTTGTVQQLLNRPALTFADWAAEHAAAFRK